MKHGRRTDQRDAQTIVTLQNCYNYWSNVFYWFRWLTRRRFPSFHPATKFENLDIRVSGRSSQISAAIQKWCGFWRKRLLITHMNLSIIELEQLVITYYVYPSAGDGHCFPQAIFCFLCREPVQRALARLSIWSGTNVRMRFVLN